MKRRRPDQTPTPPSGSEPPPSSRGRPPRAASVLALAFFAATVVVFIQALLVFVPPFFRYVNESYAPGQAIRAALFWAGTHAALPLAAAVAGALALEVYARMRK
ncbi:hypothetical protein HY522_09075 [bacterium]|nr:hypothetical protein [bacterium]